MRILKKIGKFILWLSAIFLCLYFLFFTSIDYFPFHQSDYYKNSLQSLRESSNPLPDTSSVKAGWSKASITPDSPKRLVAYKNRGNYEGIDDSIFVHSLYLENKFEKIVYLSFDYMLVPPYLKEKITSNVNKIYNNEVKIYFSAVHSHNSTGQFTPGYVESFVFGDFDSKYTDKVIENTILAIKKSMNKKDYVYYAFEKISGKEYVHNRVIWKGKTDPFIRVLQLKNSTQDLYSLVVFGAHPTILGSTYKKLGLDYVGPLLKTLNKSSNKITSCFSAGAVGSQAPSGWAFDESPIKFGRSLAKRVIDSTKNLVFKPLNYIHFQQEKFQLPSPQIKIFTNSRMRTFWGEKLLQNKKSYFTFLQIGDIPFIATPGDFSGEISSTLDKKHSKITKNLTITSFNGDYLGYITPLKNHRLNSQENIYLSWYGPYFGKYLSKLISESIKINYKIMP